LPSKRETSIVGAGSHSTRRLAVAASKATAASGVAGIGNEESYPENRRRERRNRCPATKFSKGERQMTLRLFACLVLLSAIPAIAQNTPKSIALTDKSNVLP
jgi:hypothetical protein